MSVHAFTRSRLPLAIAAIAASAIELTPGIAPGQAQAQTLPLETIVVTARRAEENLKDVPATVNVLTESTIEDAGIETLEQLIDLTPGVTVVTNTQGQQPRASTPVPCSYIISLVFAVISCFLGCWILAIPAIGELIIN